MQPDLVADPAIDHDWLALQHTRLDASVVKTGLHYDDLPQDARLTAERNGLILSRTLNHDVPANAKHPFGGSQHRKSGMTATTGHERRKGKDGARTVTSGKLRYFRNLGPKVLRDIAINMRELEGGLSCQGQTCPGSPITRVSPATVSQRTSVPGGSSMTP